MTKNKNLNAAAKAKQDEFYTRLEDIENELKHYENFFAGKVVLCNCDDPHKSEFVNYFRKNFAELGLKKLIATYLAPQGKSSLKLEVDECKENFTKLDGDGDFRSEECIKALKQADVVVTNPPFSLFREYVKQLAEYDKKFLIIGNMNAITYKEIFRLIKDNKLWLGYGFKRDPQFKVPDDYEERTTRFWIDAGGQKWRSFGNMCWFTNLDVRKRHENILLVKKYSPEKYPRYDDFDAIEVSRTADIPQDYFGVMGVPITFLNKYNPAQFEIVGKIDTGKTDEYNLANPIINGKMKFKRIAIRRR